jgi:hypothetical protein
MERVTRLEQHTVAGDNGQLLSTDYTSTLLFIPACIVRLGVPRADRLHPFLTNLGNGNGHHPPLPTAMAPIVISQAPSMVAPIRDPVPTVAGPVSAMPKLSWAVASKPTDQSQKTSLLDIQKEELQFKTE